MTESPQDRLTQRESGPPAVRRKRGRRALVPLGTALLLAGGTLLAGLAFAPEQVERVYGAVKTEATKTVAGVQEEVFGELPTVTLGQTGDVAELDSCDGNFTHMTSYDESRVPPVWAAHNGCQGDVLLPWEVGQHIRVAGSDQVYEVVDIRHTRRSGRR